MQAQVGGGVDDWVQGVGCSGLHAQALRRTVERTSRNVESLDRGRALKLKSCRRRGNILNFSTEADDSHLKQRSNHEENL